MKYYCDKDNMRYFNSRTECRLLKLPTAPRYWIKLTGILKMKDFPINRGILKSSRSDHEVTSLKSLKKEYLVKRILEMLILVLTVNST